MPYRHPVRRLPRSGRPLLPLAFSLALASTACDTGTSGVPPDAAAGATAADAAPSVRVAGAANAGPVLEGARFDDFASSSTDGFSGRVTDDGDVQLSWRRDSGAAGYNVYREGEYYTTVHEERFIDRKVAIGNDYRYEIHAFTASKPRRFWKVADGLTVSTGRVERDAPAAALGTATAGRFVSADTAGFSAQVQDGDTVHLSWRRDPGAAGYNVYYQGEYHTTVHEERFVDHRLPAGNHRYEIHSFTAGPSKTFRRVASGLTVTIPRTESGAPTPDADLANEHELVFADEFDGDTLDTGKWGTSYLWGADLTINAEEQYYVDTRREPDFGFDPFTFEDGKLVIETVRTPAALRAKANGKAYLSGVITSHEAFKFTYGYAEIRARMPRGRGYWTAFWLLNAWYGDADPEIDIVEFLGHERDVVYHTYHYHDSRGRLRSSPSERTHGGDFTEEFHTFGVDWRPGLIIYYVDGVEVHRINDPSVSDQPMYLIANTALGGSWPGSPDAGTGIPGRYEIDYIRVFRQIAPYAAGPFSDGESAVELAAELPAASPGHRPPFELWPEGHPGR